MAIFDLLFTFLVTGGKLQKFLVLILIRAILEQLISNKMLSKI